MTEKYKKFELQLLKIFELRFKIYTLFLWFLSLNSYITETCYSISYETIFSSNIFWWTINKIRKKLFYFGHNKVSGAVSKIKEAALRIRLYNKYYFTILAQ